MSRPKISETCYRALQLLTRIRQGSGLALQQTDAHGLEEIDRLLGDCGIHKYDRENNGELLVADDQPFVVDFHLTPDVPGEPHVVSVGNMADGFTLHGPFSTFDAAVEWCEQGIDGDWHIVALESPEYDATGDQTPKPQPILDAVRHRLARCMCEGSSCDTCAPLVVALEQEGVIST